MPDGPRTAAGAAGTAGELPDAPDRLAVAFARVLRRAGLQVPVGSVVAFAEALAELDVGRREHVYWAGRTALVPRPEDIAAYDLLFAAFWSYDPPPPPAARSAAPALELDAHDGEDDADTDAEDDVDRPRDRAVELRWSRHEVLRRKDFARYSDAELQDARRLMDQMRVAGAQRRSRRMRRSRRSRRPDLRHTVRRALRTGGEPVERVGRAPSHRPRRVVLLLDVSGSMESYARALLRFVHAAAAGRERVEVFALGTRLTRLSRELRTRDPDAALDAASERVADWGGGTRLGEGLARFNQEWGVRGLARGAVVVILSDGWDRGDPEVLGEQMARLARVAHRIVWVNPLKVTEGYQPLVRGMAAALPHVDHFVEGHSLDALEHVSEVIGR